MRRVLLRLLGRRNVESGITNWNDGMGYKD